MLRPALRPPPAAFLVALVLTLLAALPAPAVITALLPLKDVVEGEKLIFVATVDTVAPEKPGAVFKRDEPLKGDVPFDRLAVNLTGDTEAKKDGHTKLLLDRLEPGRKLVVFATRRGNLYEAMGFVEGTWFSLQGTIDADGKTVRWALLHCEPYLRRTFKGTTQELKTAIVNGLAKKAEFPPLNEKEPAGYGPPIPKKCAEEGTLAPQGFRPGLRTAAPIRGLKTGQPSVLVAAERRPCVAQGGSPGQGAGPLPATAFVTQGPLFGVIPSLALIGPLAIIAALFPGVAARLAVGMKRWRAFLVVASANSTVAVVYWALKDQQWLPDWSILSYQGFTAVLVASTACGLVWAGCRYRTMAAEEPAITGTPTRNELYALSGLTALVGLVVASVRLFGPWSAAVDLPMREFTLIGASLLVATAYTVYRVATASVDRLPSASGPAVRLSLSGESVGLGALFLGGLVALLIGGEGGAQTGAVVGTQAGEATDAIGPRLSHIQIFKVPAAHQVMSGVTVDGDRLYFGGSKQTGFHSDGFVFCIDRNTGAPVWTFTHDDELKPVFCTPTVTDGRVYVGEGLHTHKECRLFCLEASTGKPAWAKPIATTSHTEGAPRVANGKVYFTAGDDGLICADAATGEQRWQFDGASQQLHIDGPPAVIGNRVFVGSGLHTLALLAVDAETGKEAWRHPVTLRSFGRPLALGDRVVYGLGTGNLVTDVFKYNEEKERPAEPTAAGAVVCVDATTGAPVWTYELSRSVHTPLAADAFSVYAAARDGAVHCLDRRTGKLRWKTVIGATCTAGPAVATVGGLPVAVYAVSTEGLMACLSPQTGQVVWSRDLREQTNKLVEEIYATPAVVTELTPTGSRRVIYTGGMVKTRGTGEKVAAVFRFEDEIGE